jgi:hypothetical protein
MVQKLIQLKLTMPLVISKKITVSTFMALGMLAYNHDHF